MSSSYRLSMNICALYVQHKALHMYLPKAGCSPPALPLTCLPRFLMIALAQLPQFLHQCNTVCCLHVFEGLEEVVVDGVTVLQLAVRQAQQQAGGSAPRLATTTPVAAAVLQLIGSKLFQVPF